MRKGSKEAKAWGAKMKRARNAKNGRKKSAQQSQGLYSFSLSSRLGLFIIGVG
jgi:hypothetical protein